MKSIFSILLVISAALFFAGCSKNSNSPKDARGILISGKWQLQSSVSDITIPGRASDTEDNYAKMDECEKDNYFIFNSDGTGTTDEGTTKCNSSDPQTEKSGNWALLSNNTKLELSDPAQSGVFVTGDVLQLDDSILKFKYTISVGGYTSVTTTVLRHIK